MSTRRPEEYAPPEIFYNDTGAAKYLRSSRMIEIQTKLSMRCIEMLSLPADESCLILDVGCGAGLSGAALEEMGHRFIGTDISEPMIHAALEREVEGDMMVHDMGQGLPFRPGVFDGCISVSALQWLCCAHRKSHLPNRRLKAFFSSLYKVLRRGARAVLQFYPGNPRQATTIVHFATKAGFSGGLVVDYPHSTRAKKYFLVLQNGPAHEFVTPQHKDSQDDLDSDMDEDFDDEEEEEEEDDAADARSMATTVAFNPRKRKVQMSEREKRGKEKLRRGKGGRPVKGSVDWIRRKKEQQEKKGMDVRKTTKYTGRRRGPKF
eukprot:TRINITY_DN3548_c0_g6_i1.p1 TRINITY_DN3548_c0_g6~~TRINITY_DN3548_c0_g6_i1.p1  ORF type:complete len:320 (+),score=92.39 TRINITY_DN3548_c0_g6_i1:98-1057(+)